MYVCGCVCIEHVGCGCFGEVSLDMVCRWFLLVV